MMESGTHKQPLSDKDLEFLIRALGEIEQMQNAGSSENASARGLRLVPSVEPPAAPSRKWVRLTVAVAAAAACVLLQLRPKISVQPDHPAAPITATAGVTLRTSYIPEVDAHPASPRDCVQSTPTEPCSIVAVLRTFSAECQCLVWDLYRWDTGTVIARARPGEPIEIVTERPHAPPSLNQVVVFAVARERDLLPASAPEEHDFLDCLMAESPASDNNAAAEQYATAVQACLPGNVTVVPHFLSKR